MHRTITQLSVYQLPKEMQPFFAQNMASVVRNAVRPDERRNSDPTEASKHFIDLEMYGKNAANKMPMDWDDAVAKYSKDTLLKYGYVPYWVITMKDRLTNAFRKGDRDSILFYATDLAHYVEDANVPLHTSVNYDGQLTNQKGLHSLWESTVPELMIQGFDLEGQKKAKYLKHPAKEIWKAVRRAAKLVSDVVNIEREVSLGFADSTKYRIQMRSGREVKSYSTAFARAYGARIQGAVNEQTKHAANLVADFWYTAWVDAGKPDLSGLMSKKWEAADAEKLSNEMKAYRENGLLKSGWLLSKKSAGNEAESN
ncbi:hypothetical protein GCM10023229_07580 [Flavisolibacter ginsenosidimutans]